MNAGARLDRLPISSFHRRIMWLIGIGMFFDGFDIYVAATVLGATLHSGFSTMHQNAEFISVTFVGMMLGAFLTGFLGDRYGRRFTYQANLAIFGIASIAAAFAPSMRVLILLRFVMGVGLGAENVVGYATMTEFVPPQTRGKWLGWISVFVVSGSPVTALLGTLIIPRFGWRAMFALGGLGAMVVWYLRKALPESPRWLESVGRTEEADAILCAAEREASRDHTLLPPPAPSPPFVHTRGLGSLLGPVLLPRMIVGAITLIVVNTLVFGFVTWLPTFFVREGFSIASSLGYSLVISLGAPLGSALGALTADSWGRKPSIVGASLLTIVIGSIYAFTKHPAVLQMVGFLSDDTDLRPRHPAFCCLHPGIIPDRGSHARLWHLQYFRARCDNSDALHRGHSVQVLWRRRRRRIPYRASCRANPGRPVVRGRTEEDGALRKSILRRRFLYSRN